jgi:DNA-directed RNA polymerase subunit RPC12/RpoP
MEPEQAMMKFTCGECGKRFSTTDDPAPGREYRIPCECGNTIVVQMDARAQAKPPPLPPAPRRSTPTHSLPLQIATDDPFVRATMEVPLREPVAPAATSPVASPSLARRDPDYAARDEAPEPSSSYACYAALPETTRETRLAGTRALLLDVTARLREVLGAGVRQLLRRRRLVAGGAMLGAIAFALGVWVGAASVASRWKAKAVAAAAEAEARPGTAETSPRSVAALEPVVALEPVAAPVAARTPAAIAARGVAPSGAAPASRDEPTRRRDAPDAGPAPVRPAAAEQPTATAAPKTIEVPAAEEPARTANRTPKARETAMARPSERRDAEATSEPTVAASLNDAPDADAAANPRPGAAEPTSALPGK